MPTRDQNPKRPLWVGGLFFIAFLCFMLAAGLEVEGLYRSRHERLQATQWPAVRATVAGCYPGHYYPFQGDGGGVMYTVWCSFRYSVNGTPYQASFESVGRHHNVRKPKELPEDAREMVTWAEHHPKGSTQVIHYDPADPRRISLAGANDDIRVNTAAATLNAARQAAIVGVGLLLLSLAALAFSLRRPGKTQEGLADWDESSDPVSG